MAIHAFIAILALVVSPAVAQTTLMDEWFDPFPDRPFVMQASVVTTFPAKVSPYGYPGLVYVVNCAETQRATDTRCSQYPAVYGYYDYYTYSGLHNASATSTAWLCTIPPPETISTDIPVVLESTSSAICSFTWLTDSTVTVSTSTTTYNGCDRISRSGALEITGGLSLLSTPRPFRYTGVSEGVSAVSAWVSAQAVEQRCAWKEASSITVAIPASTSTGETSMTTGTSGVATMISALPSSQASAALAAPTTTSGVSDMLEVKTALYLTASAAVVCLALWI